MIEMVNLLLKVYGCIFKMLILMIQIDR